MSTPPLSTPRRRVPLFRLLPWVGFAAAAASPVSGQESGLTVSVPGGTVGSEVTVGLVGLPPSTMIFVGFGGLSSSHELLDRITTDGDGAASVAVQIPSWVERNRSYYFFFAYADQMPRGFSAPFVATGPEGFVRVRGDVLEVADGCALMRAIDQTIYVLVGGGGLNQGARVEVDGNLTVAPAPAQSSSPCARTPAIPLQVREVRGG